MRARRLAALTLAMAAGASLGPASAGAFACYVGEQPGGEGATLEVHRRPDANSPVIARLGRYTMVGDGRRIRERDGWILVRWSREQMTQASFERGHGDGKGWVRRDRINGECED